MYSLFSRVYTSKIRNGERGTGNGERGTGNGERGTGNGERGTGNGEGGTRNGSLKISDMKRRKQSKHAVKGKFHFKSY